MVDSSLKIVVHTKNLLIEDMTNPITIAWDGTSTSGTAGAGCDVLIGGDGSDILEGEAGQDGMVGGFSTLPDTSENAERRAVENAILCEIQENFPVRGAGWRRTIDFATGK